MAGTEPAEKKESVMLKDFDRLWNYSDPAATETKFREKLPEAEKSGDTDIYIQLLTQIARAQGLQGKYDDAHKTLDDAEKRLTEETKTARIRYLMERGRVFNSSGSKEKSKPMFLDAWALCQAEKNDFFGVDALHMMGIVEPPEKQLGWSIKALELVEKSEDKRVKGWLGPLRNNIGWSHFDLKEYDKALEMFRKDIEWRKKIGDEGAHRMARWSVAHVYRVTGKVDEALEIQQTIEKELQDKSLPPEGFNSEELGELYLLKGDKEKAKPYFAKAHELLSADPWMAANDVDRLARLKTLSE